jgi:pimeloyl-ACP methyl ester carboxylesterase
MGDARGHVEGDAVRGSDVNGRRPAGPVPVTSGETLGDLGARSAVWAQLCSEFVDVRGTSVHVLRGGRRVEDGGDPVPHVFVHGLGGGSTNWLEVMGALGEDREVIAMDLPGFGRTVPPRTSAARVRANARFLPVFLDTLGIERAIVHGNSMGGMLTAYLSALAPERIARVVLCAPALPTAKADLTHLPPAVFKRFAPFVVPGVGTTLLRTLYSRMNVDQLVEDALEITVYDPAALSPAMLQLMRENLAYGKRNSWRVESLAYAVESLVAALLGGRELHEAVASVTPDTLFVWGDKDALVGRMVLEHVAARRPEWRYAVMPDVGHTPMMEAPDRYVATVRAWLEGRPVGDVPGVLTLDAYHAAVAAAASAAGASVVDA